MDESKKVSPYLDIDEAASLLHFQKSYLYRLVHERKIPHYKPRGGRILFDRAELEGIVKSSRISTDAELAEQADALLNAPRTRKARARA